MEEPNATHRVEDVVAAIRETAGGESDHGRETHLRTSLHHTHLPKLDDANVVQYDPDDGTVQYEGDPRVEQWVDKIDRVEEC